MVGAALKPTGAPLKPADVAPKPPAVASPCVDICRLDAQGLCVGCRRTIEEITEWSRASEARRREILRNVSERAVIA